MKRAIAISAIILLIMCRCGGNKQSSDDLITVDVTKSYSLKKELILQDFTDVEYIALETNDEFVNQGIVLDIGKKFILVKNRRGGDIFVYDRNGKALRKINRQGQGGEEYLRPDNVILDEDNEEIFVYSREFSVYDLYGNFKRSFRHKEFFSEILNYDENNLICYNMMNEGIGFFLISKQDGSTTKEIEIAFDEKKSLLHFSEGADGMLIGVAPDSPFLSLLPFKGNWILSEISSDTVFSFLPDYDLRPFIARTPSVQSMNPEIMLILKFVSDRYYFMEAVRNEYDWEKREGFSTTFFMYDKQEKSFSGYTVYNDDYLKKEMNMVALKPVNHELWQTTLQAYQLVESYENDELKDGKLKEIAATLDAEDNPVIMLVKQKKK